MEKKKQSIVHHHARSAMFSKARAASETLTPLGSGQHVCEKSLESWAYAPTPPPREPQTVCSLQTQLLIGHVPSGQLRQASLKLAGVPEGDPLSLSLFSLPSLIPTPIISFLDSGGGLVRLILKLKPHTHRPRPPKTPKPQKPRTLPLPPFSHTSLQNRTPYINQAHGRFPPPQKNKENGHKPLGKYLE